MGLVKDKAPEVEAVIAEVVAAYHPHLLEHDVRIGAQFVSRNDDKDLPTLSLHGYPCLAVIKKTRLEDRLDGCPDVRIQVDKQAWDFMTPDRKRALVDHEAEHVEIVTEEDDHGNHVAKVDDAGRPVLRLRRHDFQIGIFDSVIARHGDAAFDLDALRDAASRLRNPPPFGSVEMPIGNL